MKIDCYLSQSCVSEDAVRSNIAISLKNEGIETEINIYRIDASQTLYLGISGSPSVFINGKELQPTGNIGFSWRMFTDESGRLTNVPSIETLQKAIKESKRGL